MLSSILILKSYSTCGIGYELPTGRSMGETDGNQKIITNK
ncbi:hypothetical protein LEP1GSC041_2833 [Leptospira noguchii str. 2006001870]|nr:hypothetical protein LEP1GSC041_2833 [Leptospira noguchii str. 2006001870]EMO27559.1 hypothetical protein LEP1GSC170_3473 [Leptospira interrogans serovar Bataviae str. HAI135]